MSFMWSFRKYILGSLIAATVGMIATAVYLLWPYYEVFSLIHQLRTPDVEIRRLVAEKLGKLGPMAAEAVPALTEALEDEDLCVRINAALSLCSIDPTSDAADAAAPVLLDSLFFCKPFDGFGGCRGPTHMEQVAMMLKEIGLRSLPHMANALKDDRPNVRFWACYCYGQFGLDAEGDDEPLRRALDDEDKLVRIGAAISTWKIRHDAVSTFPVVRDVLGDGDPRVQRGTCALLSELGLEALPVLEEGLEHAEAWNRMVAAMRIGDLREDARHAAPALVHASGDADSGVREAALFALRCVHADPSLTLQPLITALSDDIDAVRECAARGLAEMGAEADPAIDALKKLSSDRAHRVRQAALDAVLRIQFAQTEEGMKEAQLLSRRIAF